MIWLVLQLVATLFIPPRKTGKIGKIRSRRWGVSSLRIRMYLYLNNNLYPPTGLRGNIDPLAILYTANRGCWIASWLQLLSTNFHLLCDSRRMQEKKRKAVDQLRIVTKSINVWTFQVNMENHAREQPVSGTHLFNNVPLSDDNMTITPLRGAELPFH
jgi:hypothetical protein